MVWFIDGQAGSNGTLTVGGAGGSGSEGGATGGVVVMVVT